MNQAKSRFALMLLLPIGCVLLFPLFYLFYKVYFLRVLFIVLALIQLALLTIATTVGVVTDLPWHSIFLIPVILAFIVSMTWLVKEELIERKRSKGTLALNK